MGNTNSNENDTVNLKMSKEQYQKYQQYMKQQQISKKQQYLKQQQILKQQQYQKIFYQKNNNYLLSKQEKYPKLMRKLR